MNSKKIYWATKEGERVYVDDMSDQYIKNCLQLVKGNRKKVPLVSGHDGWVEIFTEILKDRKTKNRNKIINNLLIDENNIDLDLY